MRIGLIIYGDLETITGGFLYDRMLVRHLREQGDAVEIIPLPWVQYGRALLDNLSVSVGQRLKCLSLDLLVEDELVHPSLFILNQRIKPILGCPIITVVHHLRACEEHPALLRKLYGAIEKEFLSSVDGFIFNSRSTYQAVTERINIDKPWVIACPGGDRFGIELSDDEVVARALRLGPLDILFVGTLTPRKGLHRLLGALESMEADTWRLTVVGNLEADRRYVKDLRRKIAASGLSNYISLKGEISDHELIDLMCRSHVLVVPSFFEGFGIVYLEGMCFGLPAVASGNGGAEEIVEHGVNGHLVAPGDELSLSRHLKEFAKDRRRLAKMGLAARKTFRSHPTWANTGRTIHDFLHRIKESNQSSK